MEVDQRHFDVHLLPILKHIANAEFVAVDLEMSGIGSSIKRDDKPSLQEVYEDVKSAAETYQVLQVGITCVEKNEEFDVYIARPYNFNLSPLFLEKERLGIERKFSFSSGAIHFLMSDKVLFNIAAPFTTGVPYLSREEEEYARNKYSNVVHNDVIISPTDRDALAFYRNSRQTIKEWLDQPQGDEKLHYVNITLNGRYGVRLLHQLVRLEFPKLVARYIRDAEFMQITVRDDEREELWAKQKLVNFENNIAKQTGLRFVFEALFGGDLSKLNPKWFTIDTDGKPAWTNIADKKREIEDITTALKARRPALVGHNLHTDLAFIYKTFIGKLPNTYQEFGSKIHTLCPIVIDTKYLATHNCGSMDTKSDLQGLLRQFDCDPVPSIRLAEEHYLYGGKHKNHEAGYDSWMTAELFIKLASKLASQHPFQKNSKKTQVGLATPRRSVLPKLPRVMLQESLPKSWSPGSSSSSSSSGGVSLLDMDNTELEQLAEKHYRNGELIVQTVRQAELRGPDKGIELGMGHHMEELNRGRPRRISTAAGLPDQWIPDWDSPFWDDYINRLRVFQAEEAFYVLKDMET